jgi:hypothetical protein
MSMTGDLDVFGLPAIRVGPLRVWVHGYESPDSADAWDGNWLRVTARCDAPGASVAVTGAVLDTVSFVRWQKELSALHRGLRGVATLASAEPVLKATVTATGASGQMSLEIEITPDLQQQAHRYVLDIDQSYLPDLIRECEQVQRTYPVRNAGDPAGFS